ncbi:hypothetical protein NX009_03530 [Klebsiella pneumoniae]|nr:hypothetical protein [Klebsiella pneumoniae]
MRQFEIVTYGTWNSTRQTSSWLVTIRAPVPEASTRSMRVEPCSGV